MNVCSDTQSFPTLCDLMDGSPPGSFVHGIFQAKYWSGLPLLPPGIFPTQRLNPSLLFLLRWQVDSLPAEHWGSPINSVYMSVPILSEENRKMCQTQPPAERPLAKDSGCDLSTRFCPDRICGKPSSSWRRKWQLQYSCLENPMDKGAWRATVPGVTRLRHG